MEKEILLNNGVKIPTPGFGTFLTPDGATCVEAVKAAIAAGYTHIDTAAIYKNGRAWARESRKVESSVRISLLPARFGTRSVVTTRP